MNINSPDDFNIDFSSSFQGADAPTYLALLPPNVKEPRGAMIWFDRSIVDWTKPKSG